VFAGRLAPEKNIAELLEMVDRLGDPYHLLLIGGAHAARPTPRVTILPYEGDTTAVAARLAACDLLVHAGRQETFGLVALEAMASGLPVVAYDAGALAEIVDGSVGALAPAAGRAPALAAAVADVFARDAAALGAAARARVLADYTWDASLARQLRLYESLLGEAAARHADATPRPA
jgi:alpha-1,6-mannosyltransferase